MSKLFKPMLAGKVKDVNALNYPVLVSPKLDGIRCVMVDKKALTRSLKPVNNDYIRTTLESTGLSNLDGELIIEGKRFNEMSGDIMRKDGKSNFTYFVFDYIDPALAFNTRQSLLNGLDLKKFPFIKIVPQTLAHNVEELLALEVEALAAQYEGVMTRDPLGPYKFGRSGDKEGYLLKLKRFHDSEAIIIDAIEQMHNTN
jgi:DNA ligase-1